MKKLSVIVGLLLFSTACSVPSGNTSNANTSTALETQTYRSVGVVKRVDMKESVITVDHEEIPGYMSPMEMTEPVAEPALLELVKAGDKVEFGILRTGSEIKYTSFKKIGEVAFVNGADIYIANCAECHGAKGEGAETGIPFTSGHALDHSEADFVRTVTDGKAKKKNKEMPPYRDELTTEQIATVVRFIREEIQKGIEKPKRHGHSH